MRKRFGTPVVVVLAGTLALAIAWGIEPRLGSRSRSPQPSPPRHNLSDDTVSVHVFNREGKLVGPVSSPRWELTRSEWRRRLSADQYSVLRASGTEPAFCGNLLDNKKQGVYSCAGCGLPLFSSSAKFDSGTGWPSFMQAVARENVESTPDFSDGTPRIAIHCARCQGHLGHVFGDGPAPTGQRYCLNSAALKFTAADKLAELADPVAEKIEQREGAAVTASAPVGALPATETAIFAGGCFWCMELTFEQLKGVTNVESGYCGGTAKTADYEQVHSGSTRHAEAIRVTYDPRVVNYDRLLEVFFDAHDPTQRNRQGPDVGRQYRSEIFYLDDKQRQAAETKIRQLQEEKVYRRAIATKLEPALEFFPAELEHQDYGRNNPLDPYIQLHAIPKAQAVREKHADLVEPVRAR